MAIYSERYVRLKLCKPDDRSSELNIDFRIYDSSIAQRWGETIAFLDYQGATVGRPERFYNFQGDPKADPEWIKKELKACIDGINRLHPGFIDFEVDFEKDYELTQDTMNKLHEYFVDGAIDLGLIKSLDFVKDGEKLIGFREQVRDFSRWENFLSIFYSYTGMNAEYLDMASIIRSLETHSEFCSIMMDLCTSFNPARPYLERLNLAIHRWEDSCAIQRAVAKGDGVWRYFVAEFHPTCWLAMEDGDYQHYTIQKKFGQIFLDDILPGKCIFDVFRDQDDEIAPHHYKNLHYHWGNCFFWFGPSESDETTQKIRERFWIWLESKKDFLNAIGFSRENPKMTVGRLPVAELDYRGDLAGLSQASVVKLISEFQYMKGLELTDKSGRKIKKDSLSMNSWSQIFSNNLLYSGTLFVP